MSSIGREETKSKPRKSRHKKTKTSIPVSFLSSPYSSKTRLAPEDTRTLNLNEQDKLLSRLMKKSFREDQPSTVDFKREASLEN